LVSIGTCALRSRGEAQTVRYLDELEDCCRQLADNVASGRACDYVRPGLYRSDHLLN